MMLYLFIYLRELLSELTYLLYCPAFSVSVSLGVLIQACMLAGRPSHSAVHSSCSFFMLALSAQAELGSVQTRLVVPHLRSTNRRQLSQLILPRHRRSIEFLIEVLKTRVCSAMGHVVH